MMTLQNTEGYTQEQLDALNAEFASRCESGYYDWIGTDDEAMDQAAKEFRDEVARRRAGAILDSVDLWGRNTIADYQKMLTDNPDTTIGFTLAADMIYTARYGEIKRSEARGGDKWRTIAKNLKREYGESLSVDEVRSEMSPAKIAAAILGSVKSPKKTAAARANGARGGRPKLEPYSIEWKHARKAWVQDHHNEKWGKFWKVHYIMADTEYSAGEFLTKKEALDELKKTKANLK